MIARLRGKLVHIDPAGPSVEVDAGGVTYEVLIPLVLWPEVLTVAGDADLSEAAERPEIELHVLYHATANQPVPILVGFLRRAERDFFRKFTTVEGIGPAKAVKALNVSISTVARAIEQEDRAALTRLPGIGPRAADKVIASLRGKVVAEAALRDGAVEEPIDAARLDHERLVLDAEEAIAALGYGRSEARRWVAAALESDPELTTVEDLTLAVLRARDSS